MDIKVTWPWYRLVDGRDAYHLCVRQLWYRDCFGAIEVGNGLVDLGGAGAPVIMDGCAGLATSTTIRY
jgi:hypothetical protein